ncbi:MAG TPA: hypothetical protein VMV94_10995, partial [Phycisphaerae bacterium]|nr:hypothetical protein [Phycisphaerae bacterium]
MSTKRPKKPLPTIKTTDPEFRLVFEAVRAQLLRDRKLANDFKAATKRPMPSLDHPLMAGEWLRFAG